MNGLRYLAPCFREVRLRMGAFAGRRLGEVLGEAARGQFDSSDSWWAAELAAGRVSVERCAWGGLRLEPVGADYVLGENDRVHLRAHVHERAVPDVAPAVLYEDEHYLAASKPAGIELFVNPGSGSVKSSLLGMLEELGHSGLYPAHRIDKPVSGVVCMAKHRKALSWLSRCIKRRKVRKTYLARVQCADAQPPEPGKWIKAPLSVSEEPGAAKSYAHVDFEGGKPARTAIRRVLAAYGDGTALLEVNIHTGRFHQIRCHLQHLGCPIANDGAYGGQPEAPRPLYQDNAAGDLRAFVEEHREEHCRKCAYLMSVLAGEEPAPTLEPAIWLHSWRYEFPSLRLAFEAPPPEWAEGLAECDAVQP